MDPLTDVRDISRIAYGFIASKALFAALELDLFSRLLEPKSIDALAREAGIPARRVKTLLATLTALGLIVRDGDRFHNSPASERYLTRGSPASFGEYYRLQVNRQLYPALEHLGAALAGDASHLSVDQEGLLSDPVEAEIFSVAQHAASLGPAIRLATAIDLQGSRTLLDVAGGSGAEHGQVGAMATATGTAAAATGKP